MSESADIAAALLAQETKLLKSMSDDEIKRVASGDTRLVALPPGHQVVGASSAVKAALRAVGQMTAEEIQQVEDRQARIVLLPKGAKINYPLDLAEVASQVIKLASEDEVVRFLDADSRLNAANLKKLAAEMNIVVPAAIKTKPALQLHVAQSVARDRGRWAWR
jgi:hypothetical protein